MPGKTAEPGARQPAGETASMRPQRNAGENGPVNFVERNFRVASMRPQRNAGENPPSASAPKPTPAGFNEAPAKCRGKPSERSAAELGD